MPRREDHEVHKGHVVALRGGEVHDMIRGITWNTKLAKWLCIASVLVLAAF